MRKTPIWRSLFFLPDARLRERLALDIIGLKALYRGIGTTCAVGAKLPMPFFSCNAIHVLNCFASRA